MEGAVHLKILLEQASENFEC